ncbi:DUF6924 domain-containing protein [Streptomyces sp. NPDC088733]|uniref:DUF6924 domain-containing protein n=1 Tax=Streptomyces sp. NPDC088733 TaxID=3365880 RepID=UPI0038190A52
MPLPYPADLASLVLRTDFSDDSAWYALRRTIDAADETAATYVDDPRYAGVSVQALVDEDAAADEDEKITYVFLADARTMTDPAHPLLAVDLYDEPGRSFRVPAEWYFEISANLSIANMDFADFADSTDDTGTFRGC